MLLIRNWLEDEISFRAYLVWAEDNAESEADKEFIEALRERWEAKGLDGSLSKAQAEILWRLAGIKEPPEQILSSDEPSNSDAGDEAQASA